MTMADLENLKTKPMTLQSDVSEIDSLRIRLNSLISSITNEMAFQAFYVEPTSIGALQLPLVPRGTIVGEADFDSLIAFKIKLESLQSKLNLQNSPKTNPPTTSKTTSSPRLVVLTCVKGKFSKKLTGINPKCPTGFKQTSKIFVK